MAGRHAKPLLAAHEGDAPLRLAVGGPREREAKGIYGKARVVLGEVFGRFRGVG